MADNLIECPDCGNQISKRAKACPNCGAPVERLEEPVLATRAMLFHPVEWIAATLLLALVMVPGLILMNPIVIAIACSLVAMVLLTWLGRRATRLQVTTTRCILTKGIFNRSSTQVRIADIRNVQVHRSLIDRLRGIGAIGVSSAGQGDVEIRMCHVRKPKAIAEKIEALRA